jgi:hypothetical protein
MVETNDSYSNGNENSNVFRNLRVTWQKPARLFDEDIKDKKVVFTSWTF